MRLVRLAAPLRLLLARRGRRGHLRRLGLLKQERLIGIGGPWRVVTPPQRIESLLPWLLVAAFAAQGPKEFRDHLLEDGRIIAKGRRVNGRQRSCNRRRCVRAHAYKTHER